jgi:hypothetical protein
MLTAHWFAENRTLGSSEYPNLGFTSFLRIPKSTAYFCPRCGELWGRVHLEGIIPSWEVLERACIRHGSGFLYHPTYEELWPMAPADVMMRELILMDCSEANTDVAHWWKTDNIKKLNDRRNLRND